MAGKGVYEREGGAQSGSLALEIFFDYLTGDVWFDSIELWQDYQISLSETEKTIKPGESFQLEVQCDSEEVDLSKVTWSSSNPDAVSVDENGMITAEALGTAVITAKLDESHTASCTVQVDDPEMLAPQYAEMRSRWTERLTGNGSSITDDEDFQTSMETMAQDAEDAMENMADIPADGSHVDALWSDLDLEIKYVATSDASYTEDLNTAYTRLQAMATAYAAENCRLYHNEDLKERILYALEWLYDNGYNENYNVEKQLYGNWWHWEIGIPQALGSTVILMYEDLTQEQIDKFYATLYRFNQDPTVVYKVQGWGTMEMTSANLMDTSLVAALRSAIGNTQDGIGAAVNALGTVTGFVTEGDGFYEDGSCIQHSNLAYTGGYGLTLLKGIERILLLSNDTAWQASADDLESVYTWIWEGYRPLFADGAMMDMVSGRSIARPSHTELETGRGILEAIVLLADGAPDDRKEQLLSFAKKQVLAGAENLDTFYSGMEASSMIAAKQLAADDSVEADDGTPYTKIFGSMDKATIHREGYTLGISMFSSRTGNFEYMNKENTKGWHISDGALFLYNGDAGQFSNNYWNTIDPHRLPGITTDHTEGTNYESGLAYTSDKDYAGGSSVEDLYATIAMDFHGQNTDLTAKKAWFAFDDEVVALGTDISGITKDTETIIENKQIRDDGSNALVVDGEETQAELGESSAAGVEYAWIEENSGTDSIGYYFPEGEDLEIKREARTGSFQDINGAVADGAAGSEDVTRDYLSLAVSHGDGTEEGAEDYAYVLLPGRTEEETAEYASGSEIEIISNTAEVQAAADRSSGASGYQFWTAASAGNVSADQASSVTMKEEDGTLKLGISDPSQTQDSVTIHVSGYKNLQYVDGDQEAVVNATEDGVDITVDTSAGAGKTYELTLTYEEEGSETSVSTALLEYAIELAKDADLTDVVPAVVEKFNAALSNAEEIVEKVKAGDTSVAQEMVDESWQELVRAMQYLSFKQGDKTNLNKVIAMAESLDLDGYLLAGQDVFTEALDSARAVAADENAMEKEIEEAWKQLLAAMGYLRLKPDKELLDNLISQAQSIDTSVYTEESVQALTAALAEAAAVFEDDQADKDQVTEAETALKAALEGLIESDKADENAGNGGADTGSSDDGSADAGNTDAGNAGAGNTGSGNANTGNKDGQNGSAQNTDRAAKTGDSFPTVPLYAAAAALALACAAGSGLRKQADRGRKESEDKK
ncbi:MAG: polysaccharide lyase family 8 super-sandwich domain-containing protein [Mediterraneibacter sp.]